MTAHRWISVLLWVAAVLAAAAPGLRRGGAAFVASSPAADSTPAAEEGPAQALEQDIHQQQVVLADPVGTAEQKDEAARLLVLHNRRLRARTPPDLSVQNLLLSTLQQGDRIAQIAVAKALASDPNPSPAFINALLPLLGRDKDSTDTAARALANYGGSQGVPNGQTTVLDELLRFINDRRQGDTNRTAAIHAVGNIVDKNAATALVQLIQSPTESGTIINAATDALADITGLEGLGRDVPQWVAWWNANSTRTAADLRAEWLARREQELGRVRNDLARLTDRIADVLADAYARVSNEKQQTDLMLRWLHDAEPAVRLAGVKIVEDNYTSGASIPDSVKAQLRGMIGNSSPDVRLEVIRALKLTKDALALDALLKQLNLETNPEVKVEIARTLGPLHDVKAVGSLLELLSDSSLRVKEAAVHSLGQLGDLIHANPDLAAHVADVLRSALDSANQIPGATGLREEIIDAMSKLHLPSLEDIFEDYSSIQNAARNTPKIRRAAYLGLGNIEGLSPRKNDDIANNLVLALERESDPTVRLAIVDAVGAIGSFNQADNLYRLIQDQGERPEVRDEAWKVFKSFLSKPGTLATDLIPYVDRFSNDRTRQRDVLTELIPKLKAASRGDDLAVAEQNLGAADIQLEKPDEAASNFQAALDYWKTNPGTPPATIEQLTDELMEARLRARQYPEAMKFAGQTIAAEPRFAENIGSAIRQEAERLRDAGDTKAALDLINATDAMQPPLQGRYREQLDAIRAKLQ